MESPRRHHSRPSSLSSKVTYSQPMLSCCCLSWSTCLLGACLLLPYYMCACCCHTTCVLAAAVLCVCLLGALLCACVIVFLPFAGAHTYPTSIHPQGRSACEQPRPFLLASTSSAIGSQDKQPTTGESPESG